MVVAELGISWSQTEEQEWVRSVFLYAVVVTHDSKKTYSV